MVIKTTNMSFILKFPGELRAGPRVCSPSWAAAAVAAVRTAVRPAGAHC